jgi:hypothetical protein
MILDTLDRIAEYEYPGRRTCSVYNGERNPETYN